MARLIVTIILTFTLQARAEGSIQDRIFAMWTQVKTTVSGFFNKWSDNEEEKRTPASNESPTGQSASTAAEPNTPQQAPEVVDKTPHFVAPIKGSSKQEMQSAAEAVKSQNSFKVSAPARPPSKAVSLDRAGVPTLELFKRVPRQVKVGKKMVTKYETVRVATQIPHLDIGEEAKISANDFSIPETQILRVEYKKYDELKSLPVMSKIELEKILGPKVVAAGDAIKIKRLGDAENIGVVTLKKVQDINYQIVEDAALDLKSIQQMDEDDMKFIRGLMLYVAGDKCHYAAGLFYDSRSAKKDSIRNAARYYLGDCLHRMGLFSQSADNLLAVFSLDVPAELKNRAFALLTDFSEEYNIEVGQRLEKYMDLNIDAKAEQKAKAHYMVAAAAMRRDSYSTAKRFAEKVPEAHPYYIRAQFIEALSDYNLGKTSVGLSRLRKLQTLLPNEPVHKDLHALISINLARMAFQEKQYPEASKYYLSIEKSHPLWITGLTEHAWTQLMAGDNEGAIGNMFSLQSTYLKAVYRPESYIVRTIGYLNLCQYADAYKSLSLLEREYRPWISRIDNYMRASTHPKDYYSTLIRYLTSPSATDVGGLPYQALREIGRHKDFLNLQEDINLKIDEGDQYKFIDSLAIRDYERSRGLRNQAALRLRTINAELKLIAKGKKAPKEENQLKMNRLNEMATIDFYDFQISVFKEATKGYRGVKEVGKQKLVKDKDALISRAGETLKKRLAQIKRDLIKYFENNEFLRYEVFAGSGENIRFHMAGGEGGGGSTGKRLPPSAVPENKELNWDFQGEFWEDEIGHYKSTLKDNCPQRAAASAK